MSGSSMRLKDFFGSVDHEKLLALVGKQIDGRVLKLIRQMLEAGLSVVRDFKTGGGVNQERVWRIMVDVTRLVCGEATDGFGWSCV